MLKQKVALISATLLLLSTVILPGLTLAADDDDLTGTLVLTGTGDVWYNLYSTGDIDDVTFSPQSTSSTLNHTVGQGNEFGANNLIGVVNMKASGWSLSTSITDFSNGSATIPDENANLATVGDDGIGSHFDVFDGTVIHEGAGIILSNNAVDDVWYYEQPNSGYTYTPGDVTAPLNTTADTSVYSNITTNVDGATILSTAQTDTFGIFAVGAAYELEIPGGTPAGTYTATVTYTLSFT